MNEILKAFEYNQHFVAMMNIINAAKLNPPNKGHLHHIIPRCYFSVCGIECDNSNDNTVLLEIKDHIKVHKLAMLCAKPCIKSKMTFAYYRLSKNDENVYYDFAKHTEKTKQKMRHKHNIDDEMRKHMSDLKKGKPLNLSDEGRKRISDANKGKHRSAETIEKQKAAWAMKRTLKNLNN